MEKRIREWLACTYGMDAQDCRLLRHNENETWRVHTAEGDCALRIARPTEGFELDMLRGELSPRGLRERETALLEYLCGAGLAVQCPVRTKEGGLIADFDGASAMLLRWLDGDDLTERPCTREMGVEIGRMMARLHTALRGFDRECDLPGYDYGPGLLVRMETQFCNARSQGCIDTATTDALLGAVTEINRRYAGVPAGDWQTIHSDLSAGNMILLEDGVVPIDFSLAGRCVREMDVASVFAQIADGEARAGILAGYAGAGGGKLSWELTEACFAMQIMLFVACQYTRFAGEEWFGGALERWSRETWLPLARGERLAELSGFD
jgi:Ser/Thr protein kinase RdoA (MazF antagonist)